jgi:phosphoribosylglycinamide formyltransferase-1
VKIAVLVSGSGTILESILDSGIPVTAVLADRPCRGLEVASAAGVEAILLDRADHGGFGADFDRDAYSAAVSDALVQRGIGLVAMAGFGTVLAKAMHDAFPGRILNTHPALLPAFPGWHGVEDALAAGVDVTGCTVHLATVEMDAGPILDQVEVPVLAGDDAASLHERIKAVERVLYPATITAAAAALDQGRSIETVRHQHTKETTQ